MLYVPAAKPEISKFAVPFLINTEYLPVEKLPYINTSSVASSGRVIFTFSVSKTVMFATSTFIS